MAPRLLACSHDFSAFNDRTAASSALGYAAPQFSCSALLTGSGGSGGAVFYVCNDYNRSMWSMFGCGLKNVCGKQLLRISRGMQLQL